MDNQKYIIVRSRGKVVEAIRRGHTTSITDGSFKDKREIVVCILDAIKDGESRIHTVHDTPGRDSDDVRSNTILNNIPRHYTGDNSSRIGRQKGNGTNKRITFVMTRTTIV